MAFDFESFCKQCHGLSKTEIVQKMNEKINDLKVIANVRKKSPQLFQERNFASIDKSDIKTLDRMANYIAGQSLLRTKFTEDELKLVDGILEKMC